MQCLELDKQDQKSSGGEQAAPVPDFHDKPAVAAGGDGSFGAVILVTHWFHSPGTDRYNGSCIATDVRLRVSERKRGSTIVKLVEPPDRKKKTSKVWQVMQGFTARIDNCSVRCTADFKWWRKTNYLRIVTQLDVWVRDVRMKQTY